MTSAERIVVLVAATITATFAAAHADRQDAETLFRDGRRLVKAGNTLAGCNKIEASERLESRVGTLLNLGDCKEKLGKLASAWHAFRKAEARALSAGNDEARRLEARRRAARIEPYLSTLTIEVRQPFAGAIVRRNGEVVEAGAWNNPVPVDAATYEIVAEAPGRVPWHGSVTVLAKSRSRLTVPILEPVAGPAPAAPPLEPAPPAEPPRPITVVAKRAAGTWSTTRKVSIGVALAGAGAIGAGVYFGVRAAEKQDEADLICPGRICEDPLGLRLNDEAQSNALRANVLYVAGGAAVVTATVLWFVGKPDAETVITPTVGRDGAGVSLARRF